MRVVASAADEPMDEPTPPSSSAHAGITMGEAPEDDKVIVADKQWHAQEQVDDIVIMVAVDVHQQEALLMSY